MLVPAVLLFRAMRDRWRGPLPAACAVAGFFLVVDSRFFVANLWKVAEGGWLPLTFAALLFCVMVTWRTGVDAIKATLSGSAEPGEQFLSELKKGLIPRVNGTTVFLTRSTQKVSKLIMDHARFVGVLPRHAIALSVVFESTPRVFGQKCTLVEDVGEGLWRVVARFGFFEIPDLMMALGQAQRLGSAVHLAQTLFACTR